MFGMWFAIVAKVNKLTGLENLRFIYLWFDQKKLILQNTNLKLI